MAGDIEALANAYKKVLAKHEAQTNFERIKAMDISEFIAFLKTCKFDGFFPVIEGNRFFTDEDMLSWFEEVPLG